MYVHFLCNIGIHNKSENTTSVTENSEKVHLNFDLIVTALQERSEYVNNEPT